VIPSLSLLGYRIAGSTFAVAGLKYWRLDPKTAAAAIGFAPPWLSSFLWASLTCHTSAKGLNALIPLIQANQELT